MSKQKSLFLLRHGEAAYLSGDDAARPLTQNGAKEAQIIAEHLKNYEFDLILTSLAKRALQTTDFIKTHHNCPVITNNMIYKGNNDSMAHIIKSLPDSADTVLIVGHNPVITNVMLYLNVNVTNSQRSILNTGYTCKLSHLRLNSRTWGDIDKAVIIDVTYPALLLCK